MSRSRRLSRLWNAVSAVLRPAKQIENRPARAARRQTDICSIETRESRQMLDGTPANILGSISSTYLSEGGCTSVSVSAEGGDDLINSWTITWGDGTASDIYGTSGSCDHTYNDSGVYSAYATPNGSCQYTDPSWDVTVADVAPTASFGAPGSANEGDTVTLFTSPYDPSPADTQAGFHYSISLSGGSNLASTYAEATQVPQFTFPDDGYFTVYGRIFDQDGAYSDYSAGVYVCNLAPTASFSVSSTAINEGQSVTVSLLDGSDGPADVQAGLHIGVAQNEQALAGSYGDASTSSEGTFFYDDNGSFALYARIFDKDGGYTQYSIQTINVNNVPPTGCLTVGNSSFNEGDSVSVGFTGVSDPSLADAMAGLHYSYALDTGGLAASYAGAGSGSDATLQFDDSGYRSIYGRIFDKDDGYTQYTFGAFSVNNIAPTATFTAPGSANECDTVSFFSSEYDPSSVDTQAGFRYSYALDSGNLATSYLNAASSPLFTFPDNGSYTVYGRIFDKDDGYTDYSASVCVGNIAPAAVLTVNRTTGVASFSAQQDSSADLSAGLHYSYALDSNSLASDYGDASPYSQYNFPTYGSYSVFCRVFDKDGASTDYSTSVVIQYLTSIGIAPPTLPLACEHTHHFIATGYDQFGGAMDTQPVFAWSAAPGDITQAGLYTAPDGNGTATITASTQGMTTQTTLTVVTMADGISATGPANPVAEGQAYTLTLSAPEGIGGWIVDLGDGSTPLVVPYPYIVFTHTYTAAPTGPIYATAMDGADAYDADPVYPDLRPSAPTGLSGSAISGQQVTLAWTDNSGIEDGFLIEQAEGTGDFTAVAFAPADSESITLPGPFDPSVAYHFRVSALSGATLSVPTNTLDLSSPAVPNYPTGLTAVANSQTQITLTWTDHAADNEPYSLQRSGDNGTTWTTIPLASHATGYVDTGRNSGMRYLYRVFASNTAGNSGYAAAELDTLPATPGSLTATPVSFRRIDLDWADTPGNDIAGYYIYRGTTSDFTPGEGNLIDTAGESSYSDTTVTAGNTYYYKIVAISGDGIASAASAQASAAPLSAAPAASGGASVVEGATYTLTLSPNANPAGGWSIFWGDGVTDTPAATDTTATHTFTGQADTRDILVRYEDADGIFDLASITVSITNAAPAAGISGNTSSNEGSWYTLNLAATDPGQNPIASWHINWGDGSTGQPDIQTIYGNPSTLQHFYAAHGAYTITATATDSRGGTSADATFAITVADVLPTLSVSAPAGFPDAGTYTLHLVATDPGQDAFAWDIDWDDGTTSSVTAQFIGGVAEADITHGFAGNAAEYTITIGADGVPEDTALPQPLNAARGDEQTQLYHAWVGGGADGTIDIAGTSVNLKPQYTDSPDPFGGTSDIAYLPIGSDIAQSVIDAMQGQIIVNREGSDGKDSFVEYDHTLQWPDDFNITVEAHHGIYFDSYTVKYVVNEPEEEWTEDGISWHMRAHGSGSVDINPVQITNSAGGSVTEGSSSNLAFGLGRTNSDADDGPLTVSFKIGGEAIYGQRYTFEADTTVSTFQRLSFTAPGDGGLMTVTFPTGVTWGQLFVVPVNDDVPQWTQRITLTLADPDVTEYIGSRDPHVMEIVDNDDIKLDMTHEVLVANYNDDNGDGMADYKGAWTSFADPSLYLLQLTVPAEIRPGASIMLEGPNDKVRFWSDSSKTVRIGGGDDGDGASVEWIEGTDDIPMGMTITDSGAVIDVWVEVIHGSAFENDIWLTLSTADARPRVTYPTDEYKAISRTAVGVHTWWINPETGIPFEAGLDVGPVVIGDRLKPYCTIEAPSTFPVTSIAWAAPGVPMIWQWRTTNTSSTIVSVDQSSWQDQRQIDFVPTEGLQGAVIGLSVTLGGVTIDREFITDILEPWNWRLLLSTTGTIATGTIGVVAPSTLGVTAPIDISANCFNPLPGSGQGDVEIVVTARHYAGANSADGRTKWRPAKGSDIMGLYGSYPLFGPAYLFCSGIDQPLVQLTPKMARAFYWFTCDVTLMYRPPSATGLAEWVPIASQHWEFSAQAVASKTQPGVFVNPTVAPYPEYPLNVAWWGRDPAFPTAAERCSRYPTWDHTVPRQLVLVTK